VDNKRQKWQRFPDDEEFTLRPVYERSEYCVAQHHHPKSGEILGLKDCEQSIDYTVGQWVMYKT